MSLAGHMAPVKPRLTVPRFDSTKHSEKVFKEIATPFALWVVERPLTGLPKVYVNNSIVVVGASRTGLAFLETLIMGATNQYLTFSNITLVSEHGLPTVAECLRAADTCVPRDGRYTDRYLKSVPFYFYLDVMSSVMVGIDRKKKCIHLKGGGVKYYDELVLTCGQQFQHPNYLRASLQLVKEIEKGKPCERTLMDDPKYKPDTVPAPLDIPENVMLINSLFEANICLRKLMRMISDLKDTPFSLSSENQVIVYGDCVETYCCIAALLELGLTPNMITFVEPFPPKDPTVCRVNCFNNDVVDDRVQASLTRLGIRVYHRYYFDSWTLKENRVYDLHFMSTLHALSLRCFALFYYSIKAINVHAFQAINECGLVYDGGLVVSSNFETNDPCIYGAGTCVRYSRRLYASRWLHRYYSSEDVGETLANIFLNKLDPFVATSDEAGLNKTMSSYFNCSIFSVKGSSHCSVASSVKLSGNWKKWQPVNTFDSPILQSATFPGPLFFLKLRRPGVELPMEVQLTLPHQGHTLVTDKNGDYFRLHLNSLHVIDSVICISKKPFDSDNLVHLYGKHEAFFNKLLVRYNKNLIDDFYEYFSQSWMSSLFEETFMDLLRYIKEKDVGNVSCVNNLLKSSCALFEDMSKLSKQFSNCSSLHDFKLQPKESLLMATFAPVIDHVLSKITHLKKDSTTKSKRVGI